MKRIGWTEKRAPKKKGGSHRVLEKPGRPNFVFAFHEGEELGPPMLARIGRATGLAPDDL